jgi:hypothetical protein
LPQEASPPFEAALELPNAKNKESCIFARFWVASASPGVRQHFSLFILESSVATVYKHFWISSNILSSCSRQRANLNLQQYLSAYPKIPLRRRKIPGECFNAGIFQAMELILGYALKIQLKTKRHFLDYTIFKALTQDAGGINGCIFL